MREKSTVLSEICRATAENALDEAISNAKRDYPSLLDRSRSEAMGSLNQPVFVIRDS
jgi:hypothetical protein